MLSPLQAYFVENLSHGKFMVQLEENELENIGALVAAAPASKPELVVPGAPVLGFWDGAYYRGIVKGVTGNTAEVRS